MNEEVQHLKGGDESPGIVLYSVNFAGIKKQTQAGNWEEIARILSNGKEVAE